MLILVVSSISLRAAFVVFPQALFFFTGHVGADKHHSIIFYKKGLIALIFHLQGDFESCLSALA